jgi:hypothetical protein
MDINATSKPITSTDAEKDKVSMQSVLNIELLALIEYARMTGAKVNENELKAALQSEVKILIDHKLGTDPDKEIVYQTAVARNDSDAVWSDVMRSIANALYDNGTDLTDDTKSNQKANIYKYVGSAYASVVNNKRVTSVLQGELHEHTGLTPKDIVYFIPNVCIQKLTSAGMSVTKAIAALCKNNENAALCSYKRKAEENKDAKHKGKKSQVDYSFINGSLGGLKALAGVDHNPGVLSLIGIQGTLMRSHGGPTTYTIKLDKANTDTLNELIDHSDSVFYDNMTLTSRMNYGSSQEKSEGDDDGDDEKAKLKRQESDETKGQKKIQDLSDHSSNIDAQDDLNGMLNYRIDVIYRYLEMANGYGLPTPEFKCTKSADDIDKVNAISKFIVDLANQMDMDVNVIYGTVGGTQLRDVDVAKLSEFSSQKLYTLFKHNKEVLYRLKLQKFIDLMLSAFVTFGVNAQDMLKKVYGTIKFGGDDTKPTDEPNETAKPEPESQPTDDQEDNNDDWIKEQYGSYFDNDAYDRPAPGKIDASKPDEPAAPKTEETPKQSDNKFGDADDDALMAMMLDG